MNSINLIFASYMQVQGVDRTEQLYNQIKVDLEKAGINIADSVLVKSKEEIDACVASGKYNCLIAQEEVNGTSIGVGSVKKWRELLPALKIIIMLYDEKPKKMKLASFLSEGVECYDSIFVSDMNNTELLKSLILKGRTKEEAAEYYHVTELLKQQEMKKAEQKPQPEKGVPDILSQEQNEKSKQEERIPQEEEAAFTFVPQHFPEFNGSPANINEALERLDQMQNGEAVIDLFGSSNVSIEEGEEKTQPKDGKAEENFFDEKVEAEGKIVPDLHTENDATKEKESMPQSDKVLKSQGGEIDLFGDGEKSQNNTSGLVPLSRKRTLSKVTSCRGAVIQVLSQSLCIMEFESDIIIEETNVNGYEFTLLVPTGKKGHVEGGRYQAGTIVVKAYANCFIDIKTLVLEVPDKDLLTMEQQLVGIECNVMVKEM